MKKLILLTALLTVFIATTGVYGQGLVPITNGSKWGFKNDANSTGIPYKYDTVWAFADGLAMVMLDGKHGFIDENGKEVIPIKYDGRGGGRFTDGLTPMRFNGKWGVIDRTDKTVIPFKYDWIGDFAEGLVNVQLNGKWGFVDKTDKTVIPFKYEHALIFSEGLAQVRLNGKWGFIDKADRTVIPFKYDGINDLFNDGLAIVQLNGKWGVIDKTGKTVIPFKYDWLGRFMDGIARANFNGKAGYIDKTDRVIIPFKYDGLDIFREGLAIAILNGKYGIIDKDDKIVIPFKYDELDIFREGLAMAIFNGKWGYIDKAGREIIPIKYDELRAFGEGLARAKRNGRWGFVNQAGVEVIPCQYDSVNPYYDGLAAVRHNGKWGFIDKNGTVAVPFMYATEEDAHKSVFRYFAKNYVELKINDWQEKGEFERTVDWQQRVNASTRQAKANELLKEAEETFITEQTRNRRLNLSLGRYDADNETFLIRESSFAGELLVYVPFDRAPHFRDSWNSIRHTPRYVIDLDHIALAEISFRLPNGETYKYNNQASLNYTIAQIDYNFAPINLNMGTTTISQGNQNISTVNLNVGRSDVAMNIPTTNIKNDKTFALIIANEDYQRESRVEFAKNDGETFREYCIKTLGIPASNVHLVVNATLNNIIAEIDWISQVANAFKDEISIIFYYAGHGIPDESSRTSYLLPVDGLGSNVRTAYKLDDLYQTLGKLPVKNVTVFMDACFSGAQRSGDMLASARGVAIRSVQGVPVGNMVVFSAAQGDETAFPHREKEHGLFTYFLLKKLQETKGDVTLGELSDYITTNVRQQSILINRKSQTPSVTPAPAITNTWRNKKLK